jgi:two-component system, sensor histidine kinase ChiS
VNMVSHELRTPLTAIKEGIGIVIDGSAGPLNAEQQDFLGLCRRNVERLSRLINDVLDFQKPQAGRVELRTDVVDINALIREVFYTMQPVAKSRGLEMGMRSPAAVLRCVCDHDKILQVLTNLVNNAIKFTEKGVVTISSSLQGESVRVCVQDTGIGIRQEDMHKLFKSFSQINAPNHTKEGSTGLGLAICKEIVALHGGTIWVESVPAEGSSFYFTLTAA